MVVAETRIDRFRSMESAHPETGVAVPLRITTFKHFEVESASLTGLDDCEGEQASKATMPLVSSTGPSIVKLRR